MLRVRRRTVVLLVGATTAGLLLSLGLAVALEGFAGLAVATTLDDAASELVDDMFGSSAVRRLSERATRLPLGLFATLGVMALVAVVVFHRTARFSPVRRRRLIRGIFSVALFLFGSATWIKWAGPVVRVRVTTTDATGEIIPAVDDEVWLWTHDGIVESRTDDRGRASFWFVRKRAKWVPSLGPGSGPPRPIFAAQVRPSSWPSASGWVPCPAYQDQPRRFRSWFWQTVRIRRPALGRLRVSLPDREATPGQYYYLSIRSGTQKFGMTTRNGDVCAWAGQPVEVSLLINYKPVHTWPEFFLQPHTIKPLYLPAADDDNASASSVRNNRRAIPTPTEAPAAVEPR